MKNTLKKMLSILAFMICVVVLITACDEGGELSNGDSTPIENATDETVVDENESEVDELFGTWVHSFDNVVVSFDGINEYMLSVDGNVSVNEYEYKNESLVLYENSEILDEGYIDFEGDLVLDGYSGWFEKEVDYSSDETNNQTVNHGTNENVDVVLDDRFLGTWYHVENNITFTFYDDLTYAYSGDLGSGEGGFSFDGNIIYFDENSPEDFIQAYFDEDDDLVIADMRLWFEREQNSDMLVEAQSRQSIGGSWTNIDGVQTFEFYDDGTYSYFDGAIIIEGYYRADHEYNVLTLDDENSATYTPEIDLIDFYNNYGVFFKNEARLRAEDVNLVGTWAFGETEAVGALLHFYDDGTYDAEKCHNVGGGLFGGTYSVDGVNVTLSEDTNEETFIIYTDRSMVGSNSKNIQFNKVE